MTQLLPEAAKPANTASRRVAGDLAAGLLCGAVCVPYAASYAALLFSGPLTSQLGAGISIVLFTAAISAAVSAAFSSFPFGVANPDSNTTAILAVVLAAVAERALAAGRPAEMLPTVLAALTLSALVTGTALLALGSFRAGRWVRYFPYPVMGGYLAATGWLIASGAFKVAAGAGLTFETLKAVLAHGPDPRMGVAFAFGVIFLVVQRHVDKPLATPILLVALCAVTFGGIRLAGMDMALAREAGWLFFDLGKAQWFAPWQSLTGAVNWSAIGAEAGGLAALVAVAIITTLLTAAGLEVATDHDADLDKELRSGGLVNLVSAATGGYVAALSVSRTLVAFQSGGRTRLTGVIIAAVCGAAFVGAAGLVAYVPRSVLAGLLLAMGLGLLYDWLVTGYRRLHREDYAVVVLILGTTVGFGFALGVAVGILAACAAFAFNYARTHVIRQELTGKEVRSAFERSPGDREVLDRHGRETLVCRFQGFLFFGTAYAILQHLRRRLAQTAAPRVIVLDFAAVQGLDTSAVVTFQKLRQIAARSGCRLVFAAMDAQVSRGMAEAGCLDKDADAVEVLPDLDHALEWSEDRILERHRVLIPLPGGATDRWLAAELGDHAAAERVRAVLERRVCAPGDYVFREGDPPDALYFVDSGRVSVVLEGPGAPLRLHTYLGGTILGEMGLYTTEPRSASVIADEQSVLFRLSATAMAALAQSDPVLANALHSLVVRVLAFRLADANAEKAALKRLGTPL